MLDDHHQLHPSSTYHEQRTTTILLDNNQPLDRGVSKHGPNTGLAVSLN